MNVPSLYFRDLGTGGSQLDYAKVDYNFRALLDFLSALNALEFAVLDSDGTLKDGAVSTSAKFADRVVTAPKLDWWANLFCLALGIDTFTGTINPTTNYTGPGGGVTETTFLLVKFQASNTGPATFNLNSGTAYPIVKPTGAALTAGDIHAARIYPMLFNGTSWVLMSDRKAALSPTTAQFSVSRSADYQSLLWVSIVCPFDNKAGSGDFDPDNVFDPVTHQFQAPANGRYQFSVRAMTWNFREFEINVNGAAVQKWLAQPNGSMPSVEYYVGSFSIILNLALNDLVDVRATALHGDLLGFAGFYKGLPHTGMKFSGFKLIE